MSQQQQADTLYVQGIEHMRPSIFKNKYDRLEKAISCLSRATNLYYANGLYVEASKVFRLCACAHRKNDDIHYVIENYSGSIRSLRKANMIADAMADINTIIDLLANLKWLPNIWKCLLN